MERNKADKLLELGTSLWLTGCLVEKLRSHLVELVEQGYGLSSEEVLKANQELGREGRRFLDMEQQFIKLRDGGEP